MLSQEIAQNFLQAMDKHGLSLERKPEVARVVMDGLGPRLGNLRRLLFPPKPTDVPKKTMHTVSAQFGGAADAAAAVVVVYSFFFSHKAA